MYSTNKIIRSISLIGAFVLVTFALSPAARAVDPPPDGGYPNQNTAEGEDALFSLTTGSNNTAIGQDALFSNTTGSNNTATGVSTLQRNTTGSNNAATGVSALQRNTTGLGNAATGAYALNNNTSGSYNTANGVKALNSNSTGIHNTADGNRALYSNTTGDDNTAIGIDSLYSNVTGAKNIALGNKAGFSLTTGSDNIDIANVGSAGETGTIRMGTKGTQTATFIAGISGVTVAGGVTVVVDTNGQLGTIVSSARFKDAIKPMDRTSEAILALQPVTFRYKHDLDPKGIPQFGLVAEQVEKVNPDLVARDEQGKPYTVRYEAVNAMLLNEFLKEHRKVEEQQTTITQLRSAVSEQQSANAQQQKEIQALTEALKAQAAEIGKVSDQLKAQAPSMVVNN